MEKIRIALSGPTKCKVPAEFMISRSQMMWFARNNVPFVAKMDPGKGDEISYMNTGKQTLDQRIRAGLPTFALGKYIFQILEAAAALVKGGQPLSKLLLSPGCIFVDAKTDDIMLLFYPVNGDAVSYDFALFLKDLVLMSACEDTDKWIKWIESIPAVLDSESAVRAIQSSLPKPAQRPQPPINQWSQQGPGGWNQPPQNQWNPNYPNNGSDRSEAYTVMDDAATSLDSNGPSYGGYNAPAGNYGGNFDDEMGTSFDEPAGYNYEEPNSAIPDGGYGAPNPGPSYGGYGAPNPGPSYGGYGAPNPGPSNGGYNVQPGFGFGDEQMTKMDGDPAPVSSGYTEEADTRFDDELLFDKRFNTGFTPEAAPRTAVLVRSKTGESFPLNKDIVKIGRSAQRADICISDNKSISNIHAVVQKTGGSYFVIDAHSTNGTFIGDRRIDPDGDPAPLGPGASFRLWDEEFKLMLN